MNNFGDIVLTILVLGGILVFSAVLTNLFTRKMYYKCTACKNLNAKRRTHCRVCGNELVG
jgi:rRNA maturation endonuclease Nob1